MTKSIIRLVPECDLLLAKKALTTKNFELENTKPIFHENQSLTIHNLYHLQIITESFKIKKLRCPTSLNSLLYFSQANKRQNLFKVSDYSLQTSKNNFHHKAVMGWNSIVNKLLEKPDLDDIKNLIIPGSCPKSDLTANVGYIKNKSKAILLGIQSHENPVKWMPNGSNFRTNTNLDT